MRFLQNSVHTEMTNETRNGMVIIIGAGPIGLACGIALKEKNIPHLIIEKGALVNSVYHYPVNMTFFSTSERLEIGDVPFISHGMKPTRREALEYYRRVASACELSIHLYERVTTISGEKGNFTVRTNKDTYNASHIIFATGFYDHANLMGIPGEEFPKVKHYYDEPHPYAGQKVLVVGGGNSAVDVALETYRCGSEVTMVIRYDALKPGVKYWVRPDIENRIKEGEIKAFFNSEVIEIREKEVDIQTPEGKITMANDFVLAMTGYRPDFSLLEQAGVQFEDDEHRTPVYNPKTQETNVAGIYLAGVVCGGLNTGVWFIENARIHAQFISDDLAKSWK